MYWNLAFFVRRQDVQKRFLRRYKSRYLAVHSSFELPRRMFIIMRVDVIVVIRRG